VSYINSIIETLTFIPKLDESTSSFGVNNLRVEKLINFFKNIMKEVGIKIVVSVLTTPILAVITLTLGKIFNWDYLKNKVLVSVWLLLIIGSLFISILIIALLELFKRKKKREVFQVEGLSYFVEYSVNKVGNFDFNFEPLCPECNRRLEQIIASPYMGGSYRRCNYCGASSDNDDFEYFTNKQINLFILDELDKKYKRKNLID